MLSTMYKYSVPQFPQWAHSSVLGRVAVRIPVVTHVKPGQVPGCTKNAVGELSQ